MTTVVLALSAIVFLVLFVLEYRHTEALSASNQAWSDYADYYIARCRMLENSVRDMQDTLQSELTKRDGKQYTLPCTIKPSKSVDPDVVVKGQTVKLSSLEIKPITPATTTTNEATIASLGTLDSNEQRLIGIWQSKNTSEAECFKRITNNRNQAKAKAAKVA